MIYFVQINNNWAVSTLIMLIVKMFEFSKKKEFEGKTFVKENKEPSLEIFKSNSSFDKLCSRPLFKGILWGLPRSPSQYSLSWDPKTKNILF
jgi:hypothetical protein